ncbi:mechanosensitive ion channel family protein [Ulvibacterium marinum]|nr:mechanosensitive ion channel domain-containing protein [Ulvibacterium marinum]
MASLLDKESWLAYIIVPTIAIGLGLLISWLGFAILRLYHKRQPSVFKEQLLQRLKRPIHFFIPLVFLVPVMAYFDPGILWEKLLEAIVIICLAWILVALLYSSEEVVKQKFALKDHKIASERKILTQLHFLKSIAVAIIITIAIASILWNIPSARQLGNTILTSAGVAGIIIGVAAQKSISNLIVGFQLAFTQALKIDDEVVIEGEFGTVEDITLTYVVIKTWDWRRLVLPLNYFNDKPFVNWTFNSRPLIATVYFHLDYTFPVDELRIKLMELLKGSSLWDKNKAELFLTEIDNRTMEVRADFSVKNATDAWNLRCKVREDLMVFIQNNYPEALPKLRGVDVAKKV